MDQTELFRTQLADLGRKNLYFLCKGILGFSRLTNHLHREVCWVVEHPEYSKKLVMIPRGHYKSTIGTKGRSIQWLLNNSNERVLIVSATTTNAERFLRQIKAQFTRNPIFRWLYPELIPNIAHTTWSNSEIIINRVEAYPEPSIDTAGVGTALPSRHYTKIIKDDIVNDKNSNTPELIDQVIEWDASTIPLFDDPEDPSNEELVIGTPWSNLDVYATKRVEPDYAIYVRHGLEKDGKPSFDEGLAIFPERFSREKLVRIRRRLNNDNLFFCQYMCDPHGGSNATFQRAWFQYYDRAPDRLEISIAIDPGGFGVNSDFTGITVVGVDPRNDWYVLMMVKERLNPREIIDRIFDLYAIYPQTHSIGIEGVAWQKSLQFYAIEEMRKRGVLLPLMPLQTSTQVSKMMRIKGLIPRFSNRMIWLKGSGASKDLEDELLERVKNDDLKDSLAYHLQLAYITPTIERPVVEDPFSIEAILVELAKQKGPEFGFQIAKLRETLYEEPSFAREGLLN